MKRLGFPLGGVALFIGLATVLAGAQSPAFPTKAVRIIVPFPPGGTNDLLTRVLAERLRQTWNQPVLVENRAGAGGNIGADVVARSEPDGYTLLSAPPPPFAINHNLYKKLTYDPTKFVPITVLASVPNVLAVHPAVPATSVQELIGLAKSKPGKVTFASQGVGTTSHLTGNLFQTMAGVQLLHVPYKGTAPALADLIGGQVDMFFDNLFTAGPQHKAGKLRILAVASPKRVAALPNIPTIAETGLTGFVSVTWFAIGAPPNTPAALADQINKAIVDALKLPEVQKAFADQGADVVGNTRAEMAAFVKDETARWQQVIKAANVTLD